MEGFDPRFEDPPAYILGITREIWEQRQVETLHGYYAPQIPVRSPDGVVIGNQAVIDATNATLREFPDRQLLGEDVIWSDDGEGGFLSSHRILSTATHGSDGIYGAATGTKLVYRVIADCAARDNVIYDEWLIRDQGAIVAQLGIDPKAFAAAQIEAEGGPDQARQPFTPEHDVPGPYAGTGNQHAAGLRYEEVLSRAIGGDASVVESGYDRAAHLEVPGGGSAHGWAGAADFWSGVASSFPEATFTVHHRIGRDDPGLGERAAIRWSLDGVHSGAGRFGDPTGARVHVMGISHAEFGPWGLRREWVLFDDSVVWKQILLATG